MRGDLSKISLEHHSKRLPKERQTHVPCKCLFFPTPPPLTSVQFVFTIARCIAFASFAKTSYLLNRRGFVRPWFCLGVSFLAMLSKMPTSKVKVVPAGHLGKLRICASSTAEHRVLNVTTKQEA